MSEEYILSYHALVQKDTPVEGASALIRRLIDLQVPFYIVSDDSRRSRTRMADRMYEMGFPLLSADLFYTSLDAVIDILRHSYPDKDRILPLTGRTARETMERAGLKIVPGRIDWVIIGPQRKGDLAEYNQALDALMNGANMIVLSDRVREDGDFGSEIGCRSVAAMLEAASGQRALTLGWSSPLMLQCLLHHFHPQADEVIFVSDSLETEIASAEEAGIKTTYILPSSDADLTLSRILPTYVVESLDGLLR